MEFLVSVLRVKDRKPLPKELRDNLLDNATYVRRYDVWLFEGDWETELWEWIDEGIKIEALDEIVVESLGGLSQSKLERLVKESCSIPLKAKTR